MLVACKPTSETTTAIKSGIADSEVERAIRDDGILKFNSKYLHKGDKLTIHMPRPHPKEFAIKAPDGTWFYLQTENEPAGEKLMSSEKFAALQQLEFDTSQLEAQYWHDGMAKRNKVFTLSGEYLIYMADNLETEPENTTYFASFVHYSDAENVK